MRSDFWGGLARSIGMLIPGAVIGVGYWYRQQHLTTPEHLDRGVSIPLIASALPTKSGASKAAGCIHLVIGMADRAMSGSCVARGNGVAPQKIHSVGNWLQVCGPNAVVDATEMIKVESGSNWTAQQCIGVAVSKRSGAMARMESAIAALLLTARPQPALSKLRGIVGNGAVLVDEGPEALFGGFRDGATTLSDMRYKLIRHLELILSGVARRVVRATPSPSILPLVTA